VTDVDGNTYPVVRIGAQHWTASNLRVTHYRDGTPIPHVQQSDEWSARVDGALCLPEPSSFNRHPAYGLLYNFHAVRSSRGLCPEGWHVPGADEWAQLVATLGGVDVAGARMRDTATGLWETTLPGTAEDSGFAAVPAGGRGRYGEPAEVGRYATWWSSTPEDDEFAWHWGLYPDRSSVRFNPGHTSSGFSVRCISD